MATQSSEVDGIEILTLTRPSATKTVILLHGYGASYQDLAPLADFLDPKQEWNWIFPNGISQVPIGPYSTGRAWFPIRMAEIEAAAMQGRVVDFSTTLPEGMKIAEKRLTALMEKLRLAPDDVVMGGFSQGAMMALQLCANLTTNLRGLILFSGTLINATEWKEKLPDKNKVPVFQSHGRHDPMLGFAHADRLQKMLMEMGFSCEFVAFDGDHEIPLPVINKARAFMEKL